MERRTLCALSRRSAALRWASWACLSASRAACSMSSALAPSSSSLSSSTWIWTVLDVAAQHNNSVYIYTVARYMCVPLEPRCFKVKVGGKLSLFFFADWLFCLTKWSPPVWLLAAVGSETTNITPLKATWYPFRCTTNQRMHMPNITNKSVPLIGFKTLLLCHNYNYFPFSWSRIYWYVVWKPLNIKQVCIYGRQCDRGAAHIVSCCWWRRLHDPHSRGSWCVWPSGACVGWDGGRPCWVSMMWRPDVSDACLLRERDRHTVVIIWGILMLKPVVFLY